MTVNNILSEGVHKFISANAYHADPCEIPSLSSSVARVLLQQSPLHAMLAHPKFSTDKTGKSSKAMDFGSVCHDILATGGNNITVLDFDNYRTKAAQQLKEDAYAAGYHPILKEDYKRALLVIEYLQAQIQSHKDASDGLRGEWEQTLVWQEKNGVWCRARLDNLSDDWVDDYKTTETSANPDAWERQLFSMGYDIQCAFYLRGCRKLGLNPKGFRFFVQEVKDEPYAMSVLALDEYALEQASEKVEEAIDLWGECLKKNKWPGYPSHMCWVKPPVYVDKAWTDRQMRAQVAKGDGKKIHELLNNFYMPSSDPLEELLEG